MFKQYKETFKWYLILLERNKELLKQNKETLKQYLIMFERN